MFRIYFYFTITFLLLFQTGCLLVHSNHTVLRQNEPLHQPTFESEETRNAFEQYVNSEFENESNISSASFAIPFIVSLSRSKTVSENAIRNDIAARFDINRDNHISDHEASLHQ